jgi:hypothetical protein
MHRQSIEIAEESGIRTGQSLCLRKHVGLFEV